MNLKNLIDEADLEEEMGLRVKNRTIKKRLEEYRIYKINSESSSGTMKRYFQLVKTFYRHHEITIPYIPPIQIKKDYHEKYEDIPKIEHLKKAIDTTDNLMEKAIILFMSSSGTAKNETLNLTINDFINATEEYHSNGNIKEIIEEIYTKKLSNYSEIIPLFELVRIKTDYHYYTCCSDEATEIILKYLKTRKKLQYDSKLFEINREEFNKFFKRINDSNNWGKTGFFGFFHSHALRKFHATVIEDKSLVDALQGRKRDLITESYYKQNPKRIKQLYLEVVHKLRIFKRNDLPVSNCRKLKKENKILQERLTILEWKIEEILKKDAFK